MKNRVITMLLAMSLICSVGCGCQTADKQTASNDGTVTISIGGWPTKENEIDQKLYLEREQKMNEKYPNIKLEHDTWSFAVDTFLPKAAGGQLPTTFYIPMTEVDRMVKSNYAADITDVMKEYGYADKIREDVLDIVTRDGKIYAFPTSAYVMGVVSNMEVFKEAGELDENGYIKYPNTYEELGELAGRIKKKTGKAGFILPTMNNCGGWHFMNIAWSYGTEFMKQENGKWKATFDSEECANALQFVKDLKWKYDALSDNIYIDYAEMYKMLGSGQGAMVFGTPNSSDLKKYVKDYKLNKDELSIGKIPSGPAGRYTLMGGSLQAIKGGSTKEEIEAAFKWFEICGYFTDKEDMTNLEASCKANVEQGLPVTTTVFSIYREQNPKAEEVREKYINVDMKKFDSVTDLSDVKIKTEEPINCQELYSILDTCIQEVLTNKDADVHEILSKACHDFQTNYLDKLE